MAAYQVGDGNAEGVVFPDTKIAFYNASPIAQRSGAAQASFTITIGTSQTSWGFAASDQFNNFVLQLREIRNTLVALGLWAGS